MFFAGINLLFYQIKIIQQPFAGRRDPFIFFYGSGEQIVNFQKDLFIFGQPFQ